MVRFFFLLLLVASLVEGCDGEKGTWTLLKEKEERKKEGEEGEKREEGKEEEEDITLTVQSACDSKGVAIINRGM